MKELVLAGLMTLVFAVPAFSQMKGASMHKDRTAGHGQMMEMDHMDEMGDMAGMCVEHADKMGLSDDQMLKIKPIHRDMQKRQARFKADVKISEIELMEIMEVKDFDLEKANSAVRKTAELKTAHKLENLKAMKEVRTLLTDEQFKNMKKMMPMNMDHKKPMKKTMKKQR